MIQRRFILALVLAGLTGLAAAADNQVKDPAAADNTAEQPAQTDEQAETAESAQDYPAWQAESRLQTKQWIGSWLISRDGEAQHVWSLGADGRGRSYAFTQQDGELKFAYGYDIRWYFDPFTQMANIKTERRIVCRAGKLYPYFLTLKSYESDYAVKGKFAWQTTWTEASIGENYLQKSLVVFVSPLSAWNNPKKDAPCPEFPKLKLEQEIDTALDRWDRQARQQEVMVNTTPVEGEPEFEAESFSDSPTKPLPQSKQKAASKSKSKSKPKTKPNAGRGAQ